jgi:DNA-binding NtrC family response regulator
LNEADQLPPEVQHEVARVIGNRAFPLRVIATARRHLADLVAEGSYREELAYALSTLVIELPALVRRTADLPILLQWFVEESNVRNQKQLAGFTPEALDLLNAHPWPGNLNELVRVVEEAHAHADGPEIGVADLPDSIRQTARAAAYPRKQEERIVLDEFLTQIERELLRRAMRQAKGNKAKAAKLLGISRPRLYHRLMQLNLEAEEG